MKECLSLYMLKDFDPHFSEQTLDHLHHISFTNPVCLVKSDCLSNITLDYLVKSDYVPKNIEVIKH